MNILTTKLHNGQTVLAKLYQGKPSPLTFSNRTQAETRATRAGYGWKVAQFMGRPFYVAWFGEEAKPCSLRLTPQT